jgi:cell division transport system permease protein
VKPSSLLFLIQEAIQNVRRNGLMSLAALGTVTVALTVLGASVWTAYRIHEVAQQQPQKFNAIDVFLLPDQTRTTALALQDRISTLKSVKEVHLVTKEQAWTHLQHTEPSLSQALPENPLPDKLEVQARDGARVGTLAAGLRDKKRFPEVMQVNDANQEVRSLLGFARVIRILGSGAALGLFIATLFIVQNTIRLTVYARRREIRIMQMVGATPGFIRFPLLLEGIFYGSAGGALACGILVLCAREVSRFVTELHSPLVGDVPSQLSTPDVLSGLVALGALVGLIGSFLAMRRFLRQV